MSRARRQLEADLRALLRSQASDRDLRDQLDALAEQLTLFSGFTWLWGPELYRRNRVLFRPFILARFGTAYIEDSKAFSREPVEWKRDIGKTLDAWMQQVEADGDVSLFRRLFRWKLSAVSWGDRDQTIRTELMKRFRLATTDEGRQEVLRRFDFPFPLDESTALEIYRADPGCGAYLLRHLDWGWIWNDEGTGPWRKLIELARSQGDESLAWSLYRAQIRVKEWQRDVLEDCRTIRDPEALIASLEKRHPKAGRGNLGDAFVQLLEARGEDVIPYVSRHLGQVHGSYFTNGAAGKLATMARQRGWRGLWAATARTSLSEKGFNAEVRGELEDGKISVDQQRANLSLLAGVSREWNFGPIGIARAQALSLHNALLLLRRHPDLLRGPFRVHLHCTRWKEDYTDLLEGLVAAGEWDLLDFVASRFINRRAYGSDASDPVPEVEFLAKYYAGLLPEPAVFARRAAAVLGHIPAYAIHSYPMLIRENRLARLLFERTPASYLADPRSVGDLIEGSEIHVMALGYRVVGLPDPRAVELATAHADLLIGTLLRPLHRTTRMLAFGALVNAASTRETAARILARAREAFGLPDDHYPKDGLAQLVATLVDRWPELRSPREQPVIFRRNPRRSEAA